MSSPLTLEEQVRVNIMLRDRLLAGDLKPETLAAYQGPLTVILRAIEFWDDTISPPPTVSDWRVHSAAIAMLLALLAADEIWRTLFKIAEEEAKRGQEGPQKEAKA